MPLEESEASPIATDSPALLNSAAAKGSPPVAGAPEDSTIAINRDGTATPQFNDVAPPGAAALEPGERIGVYEVREHVGDGGMASVYKAWHTGLHRFEALKVPRHQHTYGPEASFLRRLLTEARTSARLHHPHIVAIHNVSEADSALQYFAMEYVNGLDLAQLLETRGRLPIEEALPVLYQVASALDYAHSQNVIHRDIKPGNILLQRLDEAPSTENKSAEENKAPEVMPAEIAEKIDALKSEDSAGENFWHAKVVDFGISRAGEDTGGTRLTRSGMIVGTPEYMSPEQSGSGDPVTYRTDIYSLAIVAYEVLCGTPPFTAGDGVSRISILMKHVSDAPPSPATHLPGLPQQAGAAILKALAKKPEDRFDTCRDFITALAIGLAEGGVGPFAGHSSTAGRSGRGATIQHRGVARNGATIAGTSLLSPAATTLLGFPQEPVAPQPQGRLTSRTASLLAGLGGLLAGAAIVFGWLNSEGQRAVVPIAPKQPETIMATPTAKVQTTVPRTVRLQQKQPLPFARHVQPSATLLVGQHHIVRPGKNGVREVDFLVSYEGLREVGRREVGSRILQKPVDQIELHGVKTAPHASIAPIGPKPAIPAWHALPQPAPTHKATAKRAPVKKASVPQKTRTPKVLRRKPVVRKAVHRAAPKSQSIIRWHAKRRTKTAKPVLKKRRVTASRRSHVSRSHSSSGGDAPLPP